MCRSLEVSFECFCESRVFEILTYKQKINNSNNVNNTNYCTCDRLELKRLEFGFCQLCFIRLIRCRNVIKKFLLSVQRKSISDIFYNNSVRIFVDRKIKFESCSSRLIFRTEGVWLTSIDSGNKIS